jgi:phage N-6-adenine-methyltransferase
VSSPRTRRWAAGDSIDDRATSAPYFAELDAEFQFTIDVAAAAHNTKCDRYFDKATNGLAQPWAGETVWCNPPYSDIGPWVRKAWTEHVDATIVMLLPASRTEQSWWQIYVEPFRDRAGSPLTIRFLPGRMHFLRPGQSPLEKGNRPPFGCVLLIWQRLAWDVGTFHPPAPTATQGVLL